MTDAEREVANEIAALVGKMHSAGDPWDRLLVTVDATWPSVPYRVALAGIFLAQLSFEKRRAGRLN
jgi:hypothetical protein